MNAREQNQMKDKLANLQARGDLFTRQYLCEKQRVKHLQSKLSQVNENISNIREENKKKAVNLLNMHTTTANDAYKRADGLDPTRLAYMNQKKLVRNLEGRLNKSLIRQNQILNDNNVIKNKIDKIRRKISNDNVNRACMEKKIKKIQDQMSKIMERASVASEQRDAIMEQKNQLTNENLNEQQSFSNEYQKLNDFIVKQQELLESSVSALATDVSNTEFIDSDNVDGSNGQSIAKELKMLDKRILDFESLCKNTEQVLEQTDEKIRMYEENSKQLQDVSGLISTDEIISAFVKNEEESFSLFNYIQAVNQETDSTLEQHSRLVQEIEAYTKDQMDREHQRLSIVNEYKESLEEAHNEREKMADMACEGKVTIEKIAKKVQTLYHTLKCEDMERRASNANDNGYNIFMRLGSYKDAYGCIGDETSERDILRLMELIEKRSMQIINLYSSKINAKRRNSRRQSILICPKIYEKLSLSTHHQGIQSHNTKTPDLSDDEESDDDANGRPVSLHEMRMQTAEKMKRAEDT